MRNYRPIIIEKIGIALPGIEILKLRLNEHLPESRSSFHSHQHGQFLIYLRGCGEQTVQGKRYPARAGTVIYVGPNERHRFEKERSRQPLCLVIDVNLLSKNKKRWITTLGELPATKLNLIRSRVSQLFEMRGPSSGGGDLRDILAGLKTKKINIKENKSPGSTISVSELDEMNKSDMKRPKKSRRKPKSERNTVSLNL